MIRIKDGDSLLEFTKKYKGKPLLDYDRDSVDRIDWDKVAGDYDGIEICPYIGSMRMDDRTNWYYTWDVASGCIWKQSALKESKLLAVYDEGKDEYVMQL